MASSGQRRRCQVPQCGRPVHSRGYCASHYRQLLRGRTPTRPIRPRGNGEKPVLAVRLPATLILAMDRKLRRSGLTRAELLEKLVDRWVNRSEPGRWRTNARFHRRPPAPGG